MPVFEFQCCLDTGAAYRPGEYNHELLHMIGDLFDVLWGVLWGALILIIIFQ